MWSISVSSYLHPQCLNKGKRADMLSLTPDRLPSGAIKLSNIACMAWALRAIIIFAADEAATSGKRFNHFPEDIAKKHLTL